MSIRLFWLALLAFVQGCAMQPIVPDTFTGPTASVRDTVRGGGTQGGQAFVLEAVNDQKLPTALQASRERSVNQGMFLNTQSVERRVMPGRASLTLRATQMYAAPIQAMGASMVGRDYDVVGKIDVDLQAGKRYVVVGDLDAYKREVWLQDADSGVMVGHKIVAPPLEKGSQAVVSGLVKFTCCNLHYDGDWISDGHWLDQPFIPAGAQIVVGEKGRNRIKVMVDGRPMVLGHDYGREHGTLDGLVERIALAEDPKLKLDTYPEPVRAAILAGKVSLGMTREQVVMSLGHPRPDLNTPLSAEEWQYESSEGTSYFLSFDADGRLTDIDVPRELRRRLVARP